MRKKIYRALPKRIQTLVLRTYNIFHFAKNPGNYRIKRDPYDDISEIIDVSSPVIVDGGAHIGKTVNEFLDRFQDPTIHAFEPLHQHLNELESRFGSDAKVTIHNKALGPENGKVPINVLNSTSSSSVYRPSNIKQDYREQAGKNRESYEVRNTVEVPQVRLDDQLEHVDIMWLDLQGYELSALKGSENLLPKCSAILTEVEFIPYYKDQPLFKEIHRFMVDKGFNLFFIYHGYIEPDGRLASGDVLYINEEIDVI
ncbi:MAG: FkbM family methyltransferase [Halobacteria archaeon]